MEQHLFSTNPTRGQSSGDPDLTPSPPALAVRTSARQRRRQRREQQEELLRRRERNRYRERSTIMLFLFVDATSMQLFLGATHKRSRLSLQHKPSPFQDYMEGIDFTATAFPKLVSFCTKPFKTIKNPISHTHLPSHL